jgi:hypothetical protein
MSQFHRENRWILDRDLSDQCNYKVPGSCNPSVNLVVLAFVNPLRLLNNLTDETTLNGVQKGMTQEVVDYFAVHGIQVMLSIGGITYTDDWNEALAQNATELGIRAAEVSKRLGVGIEIDYEENRNPDLVGLGKFIDAYRGLIPFDPTKSSSRLTIDVAAGDRYLIDINWKATEDWIPNQKLDYANAMVTARPYNGGDSAIGWWQEHVVGKPQYDPPVPPLAPAKFTGAMYLTSMQGLPNCNDYENSIQAEVKEYVETVSPHPDLKNATSGMLGIMFWAAGCQGTRTLCTTFEDGYTCEGGVGVAAKEYNISVPMPDLRQN